MRHYKLIKLNATKSTNDKVKMLIKSKKISPGDIVWADYQYKGSCLLYTSPSPRDRG